MPENACVQESHANSVLRVNSPTPLCDAWCQGDQDRQLAQDGELEHQTIQYIVGDCIPDGQGGCQRSSRGLPSSCCRPRSGSGQSAQYSPLELPLLVAYFGN
jgi:hypothetical protein